MLLSCLSALEEIANDSLQIPYDARTPLTPNYMTYTQPTATATADNVGSQSPVVVDVTATSTPTPNPDNGGSTPIGPIVGGIVGGVIVLAAIIAIAVFYLKGRRYDRPAVVQRASIVDPDTMYYDKGRDMPDEAEVPPYSPATKSINSEMPMQYNQTREEEIEAVPSGRLRYEI